MQQAQKVLVVASARHRAPLLAALKGLGLNVHTAADCREARSWAEKQADPILLLSDLSLNDGNWWSVCQDLASRKTSFEVLVVLSGVNENAEPILCRGACGVLRPPYDSVEVRGLVESALARGRSRWLDPAAGRRRPRPGGKIRNGIAGGGAAS